MIPQLAGLWAHANNGYDGCFFPSHARKPVTLKKERNSILDCNSLAGRKVIRNISFNSPTFGYGKEIKTRESILADTNLTLNAFIGLKTTVEEMLNLDCGQVEYAAKNILFMQ